MDHKNEVSGACTCVCAGGGERVVLSQRILAPGNRWRGSSHQRTAAWRPDHLSSEQKGVGTVTLSSWEPHGHLGPPSRGAGAPRASLSAHGQPAPWTRPPPSHMAAKEEQLLQGQRAGLEVDDQEWECVCRCSFNFSRKVTKGSPLQAVLSPV